MKLFIIKGVLNDWTSGVVSIKANDLASCRKYFINYLYPDIKNAEDAEDDSDSYLIDYDYSVKNKDYIEMELSENDNHKPGVIFAIYGGG